MFSKTMLIGFVKTFGGSGITVDETILVLAVITSSELASGSFNSNKMSFSVR